MKRLFAILFTLIFAFQTVGFFLAFEAQRYSIRKSIKRQILQGLPKEELSLFKVHRDENNEFRKNFIFFEDNEFRYEGEMYDVVSIEEEGDFVLYYCVADKIESRLFENLDDAITQSYDDDPQKNNQVRNFTLLISLQYLTEDFKLPTRHPMLTELGSIYLIGKQQWLTPPPFKPPIA